MGQVSFLIDFGFDQFNIGFVKVILTNQCTSGFQKHKPIQSTSFNESNQDWIWSVSLSGLDRIMHTPRISQLESASQLQKFLVASSVLFHEQKLVEVCENCPRHFVA